MATFVLIHGGGGSAWDWHLLTAQLQARDHEVIPVDLPIEDESAGLWEYADATVEAIGDRTDLVVVAHSLGGFIAPLVCERLPVRLLVLLAAMIPAPGESVEQWWSNTAHEQAQRDAEVYGAEPVAAFLHDVPAELAAEALSRGRDQTEAAMRQPWPLTAWPDVPTRFLLCRDDRFFPAEFLRRIARERLGITPDEMPGSHCVTLSRPKELADRLEAYLTE